MFDISKRTKRIVYFIYHNINNHNPHFHSSKKTPNHTITHLSDLWKWEFPVIFRTSPASSHKYK